MPQEQEAGGDHLQGREGGPGGDQAGAEARPAAAGRQRRQAEEKSRKQLETQQGTAGEDLQPVQGPAAEEGEQVQGLEQGQVPHFAAQGMKGLQGKEASEGVEGGQQHGKVPAADKVQGKEVGAQQGQHPTAGRGAQGKREGWWAQTYAGPGLVSAGKYYLTPAA